MNRTRSAVAIFSVAATVGCQTAATITRSAPQAMESRTQQVVSSGQMVRTHPRSVTFGNEGAIGVRNQQSDPRAASRTTLSAAEMSHGTRKTLIIVAAVVALIVVGSLLIGDSGNGGY